MQIYIYGKSVCLESEHGLQTIWAKPLAFNHIYPYIHNLIKSIEPWMNVNVSVSICLSINAWFFGFYHFICMLPKNHVMQKSKIDAPSYRPIHWPAMSHLSKRKLCFSPVLLVEVPWFKSWNFAVSFVLASILCTLIRMGTISKSVSIDSTLNIK